MELVRREETPVPLISLGDAHRGKGMLHMEEEKNCHAIDKVGKSQRRGSNYGDSNNWMSLVNATNRRGSNCHAIDKVGDAND